MIGVLRDGSQATETEPTRGTDRLGDLVDFLEAAGVSALLDEMRYERTRVPAYVDIALFGIAREACTNIVRHAQATRAWMHLALVDGCAVLEVADDGCGISQATGGHGIQGMGERAQVLGGTLEVASREGGGTVVRAEIPYRGTEGS